MRALICAFLLLATTAFAGQDVAPVVSTPLIGQLEGAAAGIFAQRSFSLAVYPSWNPYIEVGGVKKPFGFGAALLYPVSEYAFAGVRIDFLGNTFWAPSAVIGAKYTLRNVPMTPTFFTIGGLILPASGGGTQNGVANAVTGLGATAVLWHTKSNSASINLFIAAEKWTAFDGVNTHLGIAGGIHF